MTKDVIVVDHVTKTFKFKKSHQDTLKNKNNRFSENRLTALDNVSLKVSEGEVFGIIGFNGSGKTTLLRTIAGLYNPDSGNVQVTGRLAPLLHIGTGFNVELIASENIIMAGMLLGIPKSEIESKIDEIIEFAELQEFANMKLKNYSAGMKARLAFSTSLQVNPDILLVDEILAVGDISFKQKSFNEFLSFKKKGKTVLYTTHSMSMLPKLCNRVLLIHNGRVDMIGKPDDVIKRYMEIYASEKGAVE